MSPFIVTRIRRHVGSLVPTVTAVMMVSARAALAQGATPPPRTSSLSWIRLAGADECVPTQELARDVEERLERTVFVSPAQADVSVEGHIEPAAAPPGWMATIVLRDAKGTVLGTRELRREDVSCKELREPLALVIAVMIDPDAALRDAAKPPSVIVKEVIRPPATEIKAPPWRFDGGASLIGGLGLLPNPALGARGGGLIEPPNFIALQGFGAVWFDNTASTSGSGRATFSLMVLGGGLCPLRWHGDRLSAYFCANSHLGLLKSRGQGFDQPRPDEQKVYVAGAIEGRLSLRVLGPIAIRGGIEVAVPLLRDTFVYRRSDGTQAELFRMAPVVAVFDLGLGVVLP